MYLLKMRYVDGSIVETEYAVYTEAIVGLTAGINAAQFEGIFKAASLTKEVEEDEEI